MTLTCNTIQDLLPLWADDVLHPGSREEVEAHLAACPACRKWPDWRWRWPALPSAGMA